MAGTPKWEAPEVLVAKKGIRHYTNAADVYSFAMTLYEMITGHDPFVDVHDIFELKKLVVDKHKRPKIPKSTPSKLGKLITECWDKNPEKRPSFEEIKAMVNEI